MKEHYFSDCPICPSTLKINDKGNLVCDQGHFWLKRRDEPLILTDLKEKYCK